VSQPAKASQPQGAGVHAAGSSAGRIEQLARLWERGLALRFSARDAAAHQQWRTKLRQTVARLAALELESPVSVRVEDAGPQGSSWREDWLIEHRGHAKVHAILLRPAKTGTFPAVLVHSGRNADIAQVAGVVPPDYPDRRVAQHLTQRGLTTLTLSPALRDAFSPDTARDRDDVNLLGLVCSLCGTSPLALAVSDSLAALTALKRDAGVTAAQIGLFGHSLGAQVALHAALLCDEPMPLVLASFFGSYWQQTARDAAVGAGHALPGIGRYADLPDLVAALAPTPVQLQHGRRDPQFPFRDAEAALGRVRESFDVAGGCFEFLAADMGHGTDLEAAARFFEATLPTKRAQSAVPAAKVVFTPSERAEILDRVDEALASGSLTLGEQGLAFEALARQHTSAAHAIAVSSGTAALEVALRVLGVEGRQVLVPANTFFATALAALHAGARVNFVDLEPVGLGMDPMALEAQLARHKDVAAVVLVHIGGVIAPSVREILKLCAARDIPVVEDAAHALGSQLDGHKAGSLGVLAAFSYYPTKIVTSGEGGLIAAKHERHAIDARARRDQGKPSFEKNYHDRIGNNWRMSELHAAVGVVHLRSLGRFIAERREQAAFYDQALRSIPRISALSEPRGSVGNYYKYIALLEPGQDRDALKARLREKHRVSLAGEVYQMPCCAQPYFRDAFSEAEFPAAYDFCRRHVCLPLFSGMSREQQERVVSALAEELGGCT
jgi:perosamine synthetase